MDFLRKQLVDWSISFESYTHPAVFTCEQAKLHLTNIPGVGTKNLFLMAQNTTNYFLITTTENKRVDLRAMAKLLGVKKLSFGNEKMLKEVLGIAPGSVSLLALINDKERKTQVLIDSEIWGATSLQCHPLTNDQTLVLSPSSIELFLKNTGHEFHIREIPFMP